VGTIKTCWSHWPRINAAMTCPFAISYLFSTFTFLFRPFSVATRGGGVLLEASSEKSPGKWFSIGHRLFVESSLDNICPISFVPSGLFIIEGGSANPVMVIFVES
jgi:hypothetical protein